MGRAIWLFSKGELVVFSVNGSSPNVPLSERREFRVAKREFAYTGNRKHAIIKWARDKKRLTFSKYYRERRGIERKWYG
jgi:hypothetical protein